MLPQFFNKISITLSTPMAIIGLLAVSVIYTPAVSADWSDKQQLQLFAKRVSVKNDIPIDELQAILDKAEFQPAIIEAISKPVEHTITWERYRKIFIQDKRIQGGVKFMQENAAALQRASQQYGVPAELITAIIGVETRYGEVMGKYRVIDALTTLAFEYPKRSTFFTKELEHFLLLTREQKVSPLMPVGSYAGAMGFGQFMPSSYRSYAVDFDADNVADIWTNKTDAIGSVANYFKRHGWRKDGVVVLKSSATRATPDKKILNDSLKPNIKAGDLSRYGLQQPEQISDEALVAPFLFEGEHGPEYILGLRNFYVITRYNHSRLYALAVYQLSQAIRAAADDAVLNATQSRSGQVEL